MRDTYTEPNKTGLYIIEFSPSPRGEEKIKRSGDGEENQRFQNATRSVAGKKIKGRGAKLKATQLYTPLE